MIKSFFKIHNGLIVLLLLQLQACGSSERIEVENARIRTPTTINQALGGFMIIKNNTKTPIALVEAKATGFKQVMLHETINKDGMHRMEHREKIIIPAKGEVIFQHGSYHIMFMGSMKLYKSGDIIPVTLIFSDGQKKVVSFNVKKPS